MKATQTTPGKALVSTIRGLKQARVVGGTPESGSKRREPAPLSYACAATVRPCARHEHVACMLKI